MDWCCIAAINNEATLSQNLCASPSLRSEPERLTILRNQPSASVAYNVGLDMTTARYCVFVHQDVYLPKGWPDRLAAQIAVLNHIDSDWAVAGLFGVSETGTYAGRVWTTSLLRELGEHFDTPIPVQSVDELLIIVDRSKGLRFDENLPSFHLYGTDIVQLVRKAGLGAYVIHAPVIHNDQPIKSLRSGFLEAHNYMRRKWRNRLPIATPVTKITTFGTKTYIKILKEELNKFRNRSVAQNVDPRYIDPIKISNLLGYE